MFEALDAQLKEELPQLLDLRVPYLDPSFECMVRFARSFRTRTSRLVAVIPCAD